MKATLSKRRHPASAHRRPKHRPVRHAHKRHAVPAAAAAATAVIPEEEPVVVIESAFVTFSPDKREEELSDEDLLDREERQDLY
jgi:hypothetical protein